MTTATLPPAPRAYSPREVGDALGINELTVRMEVRRGKLRAIRVGRLLRIPADALSAYLSGEHVDMRRPVRPARPERKAAAR